VSGCPVCTISRWERAPRVDGNVFKSAWEAIEPCEFLSNQDGAPGAFGWAKAAWHAKGLCFAFWAPDEDPWATLTEFNAPLYEEEVFECFLQPDQSKSEYFELEWNPAGAAFAGRLEGIGEARELDLDWGPRGFKWRAKVLLDKQGRPTGWACEAALPFAAIPGLEQAPRGGDRWRGNFYRIDRPGRAQRRDLFAWSPTLAGTFHAPERFGILEFGR